MEQLEVIKLLASKLENAGIHYQRCPEEVFQVMKIDHKTSMLIKYFAANHSDVIGNVTRREIYEHLWPCNF